LNPVERILVVIFILVQCRISMLLLRAAGRRFSGSALIWARVVVLVLDVFLVVGYSFTWSDMVARTGIPGQPAMLIGACVLVYFMAATAVLVMRTLVNFVRNRLAADTDPGRRRALNTAGNVLMSAPFAVMGYGSFIQRTDFHVREVDVALPGLPQDLDGIRILQLSDIHLSPFLREAELARVIDASRDLRPNIAVVTGDLISSRNDPLDVCIQQLARLKADAGIFGCMGNHERYAQAEAYATKAAAKVGIRFLRSQSQPLRFGNSVLNIAGVDYQSLAGKQSYLAGAERLIQPGACNVLLSHNPDVFPVAVEQGYNLVLAGHTHGGQVTIEILDQSINPARFLTPYVYGLFRSGSAAAYVTRGIGTIGIPTRIGAPPEISVLRLRKA
jgi:predicted MPP superfamily phosphohydrolase